MIAGVGIGDVSEFAPPRYEVVVHGLDEQVLQLGEGFNLGNPFDDVGPMGSHRR